MTLLVLAEISSEELTFSYNTSNEAQVMNFTYCAVIMNNTFCMCRVKILFKCSRRTY